MWMSHSANVTSRINRIVFVICNKFLKFLEHFSRFNQREEVQEQLVFKFIPAIVLIIVAIEFKRVVSSRHCEYTDSARHIRW
jgi:hypothetical protein